MAVRRSLAASAHFALLTILLQPSRWWAAAATQNRAKFLWLSAVSCFWTSCRSFSVRCLKCYGSLWKVARCAFPEPRRRRFTPPPFSWSQPRSEERRVGKEGERRGGAGAEQVSAA